MRSGERLRNNRLRLVGTEAAVAWWEEGRLRARIKLLPLAEALWVCDGAAPAEDFWGRGRLLAARWRAWMFATVRCKCNGALSLVKTAPLLMQRCKILPLQSSMVESGTGVSGLLHHVSGCFDSVSNALESGKGVSVVCMRSGNALRSDPS